MLNKSYSYLIPLLNEVCPIDGDYFVMIDNVYCCYNDELDHIVIAYHMSDNEEFLKYIEGLKDHELFKESFERDDLIYLVFNFPDDFKTDYDLFIKGAFSKFSDNAKYSIINYLLRINKVTAATTVKRVLYKDEKLRRQLERKLGLNIDEDLELSSIPDLEVETCYN